MKPGSHRARHGIPKMNLARRLPQRLQTISGHWGESDLTESDDKQFELDRDRHLPDAQAGGQTLRSPVIESRHTR